MDASTNEIKCLRWQILKSLKGNKTGSKGHNTLMKKLSVDLPLSEGKFKKRFIPKLKTVKVLNNGSVKGKMTIDEMKRVMGEDVTVYNEQNASTSNRIFGPIDFHYREKKVDIFAVQNCNR